MQVLYTENDLQSIKAQLKKRKIVLLLISVVFLALVVYTLVIDDHKENRPEVWTTVFVMLWGFSFIFFWDMFCQPLRKYIQHLEYSLHGRSHEVEVEFSHWDAEDSVVEGVRFRDAIFLGEANKHGERDRMFYWDIEKPLPTFSQGDSVLVQYYDRFITGYEILN